MKRHETSQMQVRNKMKSLARSKATTGQKACELVQSQRKSKAEHNDFYQTEEDILLIRPTLKSSNSMWNR